MDENYLSALNAINRTQPRPALSKPGVNSGLAANTGANFQQLLMGLLLTGLNSSGADSSSADNGLTSSANSLAGFSPSTSPNSMTTMLVNLIEQLLASQLGTLQAKNGASSQTTNTDLTGQSGGGVLLGLNPATPVTPGVETNAPKGRPVQGVLTQGFHSGHHALDFGVVVGTPVHATMDGKVIYAGWNNEGYGNLVIVQNGDFKTYYAHLSNIPVSINQSIKAGSVVGLSGNTGNSTGPHLHYEVRKNNVAIDPTGFTLNQK